MTPAPKVIETLAGGDSDATVEVVELAGERYVLKTDTIRGIAAQRFFYDQLAAAGADSLVVQLSDVKLSPNEILLRYIPGSPTVHSQPELAHYEAWGREVRQMHNIKFSEMVYFGETGALEIRNWPESFTEFIADAIARKRLKHDLTPDLLDQAEAALVALPAELAHEPLVLIHGDMHVRNVLIDGSAAVLFDNEDDLITAPAGFDLAQLITETFPVAVYPELGRPYQLERYRAFMDGYGELPARQSAHLKALMLARALDRYPNPHVAWHEEITTKLIKDLAKS